MARMMDSLILDNLAPFAFTKITTHHRARGLSGGNNENGNAVVKKASSQSNLQHQSGMGNSSLRVNIHKKIPTQGKLNHLSFFKYRLVFIALWVCPKPHFSLKGLLLNVSKKKTKIFILHFSKLFSFKFLCLSWKIITTQIIIVNSWINYTNKFVLRSFTLL